jgi:hypothetical protein
MRETGQGGNERVLQAAWRALTPERVVKGRDGATYSVLYPGRPAGGPGPDFRDAVLKGPDGQVMRGDVEIHVRPSGWRAHRHHMDPRYNGVAFHITARADVSGADETDAPRTQSGRPMHLLVLGSSEHHDPPPDPVAGVAVSVDRDVLARSGDQRFLGKSAGLSIALRKQGGDEAVWAAVLDCLGYSRNRRAFRGVAARLPWWLLRAGMNSGADASSMLMWAGGFGPKPLELKRLSSAGHPPGVVAPAPEWVPGGRPDNSPGRRLAAATALAGRWREDGPLRSVIKTVRTASGPRELIDVFRVGANAAAGTGARALIGEGRAREIVVNAALPAVHGWSIMADRWDVAEKALALYRDHPKLPDNAVTREMVSVLESRGLASKMKGAREQQGVILMYRAMTAGPLYVGPPATQKEQ